MTPGPPAPQSPQGAAGTEPDPIAAMQFVPPTRRRQRLRLELPGQETTARQARPLLLVLGLPTFGLAFAITVLTVYGPPILLPLTHNSAAKVGALIGGEGAFALVVPLISGALSDRVKAPTRSARRLPFVLVGAPLAAAGLVLLPFVPNLQLAGVTILMFFVGYYLYYPPYRAIYADLLPRRLFARAQSAQAVQRGAGFGIALISGGLLLSLWTPLPFVLGAAVLGLSTLTLKPVIRLDRAVAEEIHDDESSGSSVRELFLHNRKMQAFAVANMLWEFSLAGLKVFIVLYITHGLGKSKALASAFLALVALAYVVGAPIASRLADRYGIVQVMKWSAAAYGLALCIGVIPTTATPMTILLPIGALAGAMLMTLPQALAFTLAPEAGQGAAAGLVDFSRGVGVVLGPVLVGAAVSSAGSWLPSTHGYAIMWPAIGLPVLASLVLLRRF